MKYKNKINLILVIIWMALIFVMSSFNSTESSNQSGFVVNLIINIFNIKNLELLSLIIRKTAHFTEYLILGLLVSNLIKNYNKKTYIAILICILYAISDEFHQFFVPGRSCQLMDMIIDSIGSILGIFTLKKIKHKK